MNYGKALRISRAVAGIQQRELAKRAGLNASHISLIEKGSRNPSVAAITKLCNAMKIPEALFTMLAAEAKDLKGINEAEFEGIGRYLARFLIQNDSAPKPSKERAGMQKLPSGA